MERSLKARVMDICAFGDDDELLGLATRCIVGRNDYLCGLLRIFFLRVCFFCELHLYHSIKFFVYLFVFNYSNGHLDRIDQDRLIIFYLY